MRYEINEIRQGLIRACAGGGDSISALLIFFVALVLATPPRIKNNFVVNEDTPPTARTSVVFELQTTSSVPVRNGNFPPKPPRPSHIDHAVGGGERGNTMPTWFTTHHHATLV